MILKTRQLHKMRTWLLLCFATAVAVGALQSSNAHANVAVNYWSHHQLSGGATGYYSGVNNMVRTTNQSTGTATSGTGMTNASTGSYYITYCSGSGCRADTGDFQCGSWYNGSQPLMHNHATFTSYFNGYYYYC
jgi:hypothetical protein